jgi:putative tricarboxylic transport membrane protein
MTVTTGQEQSGAARAVPDPGPRQPGTLGLVVLVAGLLLLGEAISAADGRGIAIDGPRLWPIVVTVGWVALAAIYLLRQVIAPAWASHRDIEQAQAPPVRWNWRTPAGLIAALAGYSLVVEYTGAGYVVATAAFFIVAARLLGSRRLVRDLIVGVTVPIVIYVGFTRLLDIPLPQGVVPL